MMPNCVAAVHKSVQASDVAMHRGLSLQIKKPEKRRPVIINNL